MKIFKIVAVVGISLSLFTAVVGCKSKESDSKKTAARPEKVVQVSLQELAPVNLTDTFTLPASLEAWEDLTLAAETAGSVWKINFQEGEAVQAGQVLLEIDPETARNYLQRDEQNVAVLEKKLKRYRQLESAGLISQQELDNMVNSVTTARAALKTTRLHLEKSFPKAPVNGIIDHLYVDRGEYVDPGKPLVRLVQVDRLKVIADVPEKDVVFLKVGQQVQVAPAAINNRSVALVTGVIESIAYAADNMTRTYRTKISIDNRDGKLRPGMIVRTKFVRQQLDNVIAVPLFAVMDRNGEKIAFINDDGVARKVDIVTGSSIGQQVVVLQGLKPGQSLIIKGQQLLSDGAKIEVGEHE